MAEIKLTIHGRPITKKNSLRMCRGKILPSKQFLHYQECALWELVKNRDMQIEGPVNLKVIYYMPTRHRVDLVNLLEATCDILVKANILVDDNSRVVASHDGSRVLYDKENPRAEIFIEYV